MEQHAGLHLPLLVNTLGHLAGVVVFGAFLVLLLRGRRREPDSSVALPAAAAMLALLWNAGSLAVLALGGGHVPSGGWMAAISFAALSLLPAVLLDLAMEGGARVLRAAGYTLGAAALAMHVAEAAELGVGSHETGLELITYGFGALAVAAAISQSRDRAGRRAAGMRAVGAMALFLFAVSFLHFGEEHGPEAWGHELIFHHAGIPLALFVLLQDHRFLLLDVFIRFLGGAVLAAAAAAGLVEAGARLGLVRFPAADGFAQAAPIAGIAAALLLFPALLGRVRRWMEGAVFRRGDLDGALARIERAAREQPSEAEYLDAASAVVGEFVEARRWELAPPEASKPARARRARTVAEPAWAEVSVPLRLGGGDRALLLGARPAGRRYLSDDLEDLDRLAAEIVEQLGRRRRDELHRLVGQAELQALRAQINPHFLFNSLNALYGLIPRSAEHARRTLTNLADVFRYSLQGKDHYVKLRDELAIVEAYLEIERLRMGDRLRTEIDVDQAALDARIPALSVQPLVENAVKHGAQALAEGGTVRLSVALAGERLEVAVDDDGPGFGASRTAGAGHGLENVRRRLKLSYGEGSELTVESSPAGSRVSFAVPRGGEAQAGSTTVSETLSTKSAARSR